MESNQQFKVCENRLKITLNIYSQSNQPEKINIVFSEKIAILSINSTKTELESLFEIDGPVN